MLPDLNKMTMMMNVGIGLRCNSEVH